MKLTPQYLLIYKDFLRNLYQKYNCNEYFESDCKCLLNSIIEIDTLWKDEINRLKNVKLIILSEAPLWGDKKRFFYNPLADHSQFFRQSDLSKISTTDINSKKELINEFNRLGIVVVDFSPFPLNPLKTILSFKRDKNGKSKKISVLDYKQILLDTGKIHFLNRLNFIKAKGNKDAINKIKFCYRYSRVKKNVNDIIIPMIISAGFSPDNKIASISMNGGGIDKNKLKLIYNNPK